MMSSDFPQLSLDLSLPILPISSPFHEILTRFLIARISNSSELSKLYDFINGLEDELKKIQAFQRELPLSFNILNDGLLSLFLINLIIYFLKSITIIIYF